MTRDETWRMNYAALKAFIAENGHLPDKRKVENRGLLNWWKYNKRLIKQGRLDAERMQLLAELDGMRTGKSPTDFTDNTDSFLDCRRLDELHFK